MCEFLNIFPYLVFDRVTMNFSLLLTTNLITIFPITSLGGNSLKASTK